MPDPCELISTYILAKDGNRPWLMTKAFAKDARLEMIVRTETISFPSAATGVNEISKILVRQFCRDNENIYTFCLCPAPEGDLKAFSCNWLVGMSVRGTGEVRVGCGQYDWVFIDNPLMRVSDLKITIEVMEVLPADYVPQVMNWLSNLSYPWCPIGSALLDMPDLNGLRPVSDFLDSHA